jgi:hypothetical protein
VLTPSRHVDERAQASYVAAMSEPAALTAAEILEVAKQLGVSRGGLQAQLRLAEGEGEVDEEPMLNAMRALLMILERAEAAL